MTNPLEIRIFDNAGRIVSRDDDFAENAAYDWFDSKIRTGLMGETVQLIEKETSRVLAEQRIS